MASTFPQFNDGNVEIHLSSNSSDKLVLHSHVLALHSPWFKASLSNRWNRGNTPPNVPGANRWVYELRFDKRSSFGLLTRKTDGVKTQAATTELSAGAADTTSIPKHDKDVTKERMEKIKAYKQLLGAVYHLPPSFILEPWEDTRISILRLFEVAVAYGAQKIVTLPIESFLRLHQVEVGRLCAQKPLSLLEFAITIQSHWLFKEAATHIIGWNRFQFAKVKKDLERLNVYSVFSQKRAAVHDVLRQYEHSLFFMPYARHARGPQQFAIEYFRHWLVETITNDNGHLMGTSYALVYRQIFDQANSAELVDSRHLQDYVKLRGWVIGNKTTLATFRTELQSIYREAAKIIAPILVDVTRLQEKPTTDRRSLRFMTVDDKELPWIKKA